MVLDDRLRDVLQQHRLAGARRRDDEAALPLADRRPQIHDPCREVFGRRLELQPLLRIQRREVFEEQLVARLLRLLEVDGLDLDQREVALALLRRTNLPRHRVAGLQVELANLRRRDVNVVGTGQVVVVGRAQEPEPVGQHFEHAFREDEAALLGLRLQDLENQLLLAHARGAGHVQFFGDLSELLDAHVLQFADVEPFPAPLALLLLSLPLRRRAVAPAVRLRRCRLSRARFGGRRASCRWLGGQLGGGVGCSGDAASSLAEPRGAAFWRL